MAAEAAQNYATARLHLRPFAVRDAAPLETILRRPGVRDWFKIVRATLPWDFWWRGMTGRTTRDLRFTVTYLGEDRLIGVVGLSRDARLHYLIDPEHWGQGLATEAVNGLVELAFTEPAVRKIEAEVFDANRASARVLEKSGFQVMRRSWAQPLHVLGLEPSTVYGRSRTATGHAA